MVCSAKMKKRNLILSAILAILLLALIAIAWISNVMFNFALNPNASFTMGNLLQPDSAGSAEHESPGSKTEETQQLLEYYAKAAQWFEGAQAVTLTSEDGLDLRGYYFSRENSHHYAIICHGYGSNAAQMSSYAMQFYNMGCSVLVPDARAHGESEGDYYGMGWLERRDILGWAGQLIDADPEAEIVLFGVSMGGATVMMTAGEELPGHIKCVVEDCGYTSVWDEFSLQLQTMFHAPDFPLMYTTGLVCRLRAGYGFRQASSVEQLKKARVPMLFIHGEEDTFVPYPMLDLVYDACASTEKEKLTIPGAAHGAAASTDPELYWNTITSFTNRYFS